MHTATRNLLSGCAAGLLLALSANAAPVTIQSLTCTPRVPIGGTGTCTITLTRTTPKDMAFRITFSDSRLSTPTVIVTVPKGQRTAQFTITA